MSEQRAFGWTLDTSYVLDDLSRMGKVVKAALGPAGIEDALGHLGPGLTVPPTDRDLVTLAFLADCLRIIALATDDTDSGAGGAMAACLPLLAAISHQFRFKVPGYDTLPPVTRPPEARQLLRHYLADRGVLGYRTEAAEWIGFDLCRRSASAGDDEALEIYRHTARRLFEDLTGMSDASGTEPAWDAFVHRLGESAAEPAPAPDRRLASFLAHNIDVFSPIAHANMAAERDPNDVPEVHARARRAFTTILDRATGPRSDRNRILLVRGDAGSGKTHLLRALRSQVHRQRRGHAAYVQLHSRSDNYTGYLIGELIDAMGQEYDRPEDTRSGLLQLSNGVTDLLLPDCFDEINRLRGGDNSDELDDRSAVELVERLVDRLARLTDFPEFASFSRDLLRVMLHIQRRDPRIDPGIHAYLRCRTMNDLDRDYLGGVPSLTDPDDPQRTIVQLARLLRLTQDGALVFLLDQVEDQSTDRGYRSFRDAISAIRRITDAAHSTAAVFACLGNFYESALPSLDASATDRLHRDPAPETLARGHTLDDMTTIVSRRLQHLYADTGARFIEDEPTFPIPTTLLELFSNRRLREVLDECRQYRDACQEAGRVLTTEEFLRAPASGPAPERVAFERLDLALNEGRARAPEPSAENSRLLDLVKEAARLVEHELALKVQVADIGGEQLHVSVAGRRPSIVAFANRAPRWFGREVRTIQAVAEAKDAVAVVARLSEFPPGPKSVEAVSELQRAGGRKVVVPLADLRMISAVQALEQEADEAFPEWLADRRPVSALPSIQSLFDISDALDSRTTTTTTTTGNGPPPHPRRPDEPTDGGSAQIPAGPRLPLPGDHPIRLGRLDSRQQEPCDLDVDRLARHCAILGASGSGKTVAALTIVEQLLERDVPVVLVDRKGDLAGYADEAWWAEPGRDERATGRKRALRERLDIRLFTPGNADGRQLGLPAVPSIDGLADYEQETTIKHATAALAAVARVKPNSPMSTILEVATRILARTGQRASLSDLVDLIHDRDHGLVTEVQRFDDRHFSRLVDALEPIRIGNQQVFTTGGEHLSADLLFRTSQPDRVPLSIINTRFLGTYDLVQLWVSRLISEIARFAARSPSDRLQAVVMFDEADEYLPAGTRTAPTKDPLLDLLRRARSGGIGVMLATQSPGDFDYKAREQIATWLVGKVGENSIAKMRPLFENRGSSIQSKLGQLSTGHFYELTEDDVRPVRIERSLLDTRQLSMSAINELARSQRTGR